MKLTEAERAKYIQVALDYIPPMKGQRSRLFQKDEEELLVCMLETAHAHAFPYDADALEATATNLGKGVYGANFQVTRRWQQCFEERWKDRIAKVKAGFICKHRASSATVETLAPLSAQDGYKAGFKIDPDSKQAELPAGVVIRELVLDAFNSHFLDKLGTKQSSTNSLMHANAQSQVFHTLQMGKVSLEKSHWLSLHKNSDKMKHGQQLLQRLLPKERPTKSKRYCSVEHVPFMPHSPTLLTLQIAERGAVLDKARCILATHSHRRGLAEKHLLKDHLIQLVSSMGKLDELHHRQNGKKMAHSKSHVQDLFWSLYVPPAMDANDVTDATDATESSVLNTDDIIRIGLKIYKRFPGDEHLYQGEVMSIDTEKGGDMAIYHVRYEDNDEEDLYFNQLEELLDNKPEDSDYEE